MKSTKYAIAILVWALCLLPLVRANEAAAEAVNIGPAPDEALARLKSGNLRYAEGQSTHPRADAARRAETVQDGQHPIATILACSDSREAVEIVLDQGIGDVFVIRVAGNLCGMNELASAEYGIGHLGTPVCVVMGHSQCGAVTAVATDAVLHGNLPILAESIKPAVAAAKKANPELSGQALVPAAIEANVWLSIEKLLNRSPEIRKLAAEGKLLVVGAVYNLAEGKINWLGTHPEQKRLLALAEARKEEHKEAAPAAH